MIRKKRKRVDYYSYLKSKSWKNRRRGFLKRASHKCSVCGSLNGLAVHHKHYRTLGNETRKDCRVLCWECHEIEHESDGIILSNRLYREFKLIVG